jgi:lipopolysaccharide export system permease protein
VKLIDCHIVSEWLKVFVLCLGVTLGVVLLFDLSDDLPDLIGFNASIKAICRYYLVLIPSFLPAVLPLSLMVSILFSLGTLHRNNEIIAMRACGLSLFQITRSLWAAGVVISGVLFFLNAHWIPSSVESARKILESYDFKHQIEKEKTKEIPIGLIYNLSFYNEKEGRLWFMNSFSEATFEAYGLTIYQMDKQKNVITHFNANRAFFDEYKGHWVLKQSRIIRFEKGKQIFSLSFDDLEKDCKELKQQNNRERLENLQRIKEEIENFTEEPGMMKSLKKRPKDLSLFELKTLLDQLSFSSDSRINHYMIRYHTILANPFSCFIVVGIAIPFSIAAVRVNPMVGVCRSFGLFLLYFLVSTLCTLMGEVQIISPILAVWGPNTLALVFTFFLCKKVF